MPIVLKDLIHQCDTLGGSSGSPILSADDGTVIALHFGGTVVRGGVRNYARPMEFIAAKSTIVAELLKGSSPSPTTRPSTTVTPQASRGIIDWCMHYIPNDPWFQTTCRHALATENVKAFEALSAAGYIHLAWALQGYPQYVGPIVYLNPTAQCYIGAYLSENIRLKDGNAAVWAKDFFEYRTTDGRFHECPGRPKDYIDNVRQMQK